MSRAELQRVLDFILNRADEDEFEVIRKACERRNRDGAFAAIGSSSSTVMAKKMAESVESTMGSSLESVRTMSRNFVADIIRKQEPNIGDEELAALVEQYLPSGEQRRASTPGGAGEDPSAAGRAADFGLPAEMLLAMARDFVSYSEGTMAPSRQKELWDEMPRWQDEYWKALPPEIKAIVKAYLEGTIDAETFTSALLSLLEL
ncbi:MAG TPA: hypothetical protein VMV83_13230 [Rectinemataceae bacterium]|nr:hypothetical protein [Rectinemataceae bacterium]